MWTARVFLALFAVAWADRLTAKEYQPGTETAFIRPTLPLQRLQGPPTRNDREDKPKRSRWLLVDDKGRVIMMGEVVIRRRC